MEAVKQDSGTVSFVCLFVFLERWSWSWQRRDGVREYEINQAVVKIQARSEEVLDMVRRTEMEWRGWIQYSSE